MLHRYGRTNTACLNVHCAYGYRASSLNPEFESPLRAATSLFSPLVRDSTFESAGSAAEDDDASADAGSFFLPNGQKLSFMSPVMEEQKRKDQKI